LKGHTGSVVPTDAARGIKYTTGNKVLVDDVNLYMIYYGKWTDSQKSILNKFASNIGSSDWYKISKLYYYQKTATAKKTYVDGVVKVVKSVSDTGSLGTSLSGSNLPDLIQSFVDAGELPEDENGIYFINTSGEVSESIRPDLGTASFCSDYCGYHVTTQLKSGKRVQYAMVGNPISCIDGCAPSQNQQTSPNGDAGVDAMLSVFAHELTEAVTDPISDIDAQRAWQDPNGSENGDMCAWTFGSTIKTDSNGASYNTQFGGSNYMIQQNQNPSTQKCAMSA